ncbi:MAG TPA: rod shape-determining protein MreC [Gemmatimonadaceae bacterium]|nr:rod shape-determining protein MreC [Gemmatimonadaceae bacterium]
MARTARFSNRLDIVLFGGCILLSLMSMVLPPNMREPVAGALRRSLVAPLVRLQKGAERWRGAYLSSMREELRRDTLALAAARVPTLESENERLRQMLGLGSKLQWGFIPAEALQGRGRIEDFTITLGAGSRAGIRERSLVVAPEGVVGVVQTVDPTMSLAILFAHPDFRVSAMSADGSAFGIVQPHIAGSGVPAQSSYVQSERWLLEMRGVPFRSTLKPGAIVFSSGLGGIYPRGIPVGVVLGEIKTAEAWARTYLLRPTVNPAEITAVMVLTPQRGTSGLTNIWGQIGSVDSATKRIVIAGDSLARQAASAEAAARRAAIDSAVRSVTGARDSAAADSIARAVPGAAVIPRATPATPAAGAARDSAVARARRDSAARARRDTTAGARP